MCGHTAQCSVAGDAGSYAGTLCSGVAGACGVGHGRVSMVAHFDTILALHTG